jgi:hypothetical protein
MPAKKTAPDKRQVERLRRQARKLETAKPKTRFEKTRQPAGRGEPDGEDAAKTK